MPLHCALQGVVAPQAAAHISAESTVPGGGASFGRATNQLRAQYEPPDIEADDEPHSSVGVGVAAPGAIHGLQSRFGVSAAGASASGTDPASTASASATSREQLVSLAIVFPPHAVTRAATTVVATA